MKRRFLPFLLVLLMSLVGCLGERESLSSPSRAPLHPAEQDLDEAAFLTQEKFPKKAQSEEQAKRKRLNVQAGKAASRVADFALNSVASLPASPLPAQIRIPAEPVNREQYQHFEQQSVQRVAENPVSTFSIDVDTGSYANVRRMLKQGVLPPKDAVRVEELINYFSYQDLTPKSPETPFALSTEIGPNPWNRQTRLLRIGIKAWQPAQQAMPPANLVFLVDVSGSMQTANKLQLLKKSLQLLVQQLDQEDSISLVVYAAASGVVLEPTAGDHKAKIAQAIEQLSAGGSTNGAAGIKLAYAKAREAFIENGINRVILATDGDFNVGTVNHQALIDLIERERKSGIALTTLGFGQGNYNEHLMEQLADHGDGNYAYIDSLLEAQKVLVDEMQATLQTVARDVKIQIEFNPNRVQEYRLIGYENRALKREDFNNDQVDAGDVGAGHSLIALYELALADEGGSRVDALRYQATPTEQTAPSDEIAFLRLRYKKPTEKQSRLLEKALLASEIESVLANTSADYRFAAAVAAFGQKLGGGKYLAGFDFARIEALARQARAADASGIRGDFLKLVRLTKTLSQT